MVVWSVYMLVHLVHVVLRAARRGLCIARKGNNIHKVSA